MPARTERAQNTTWKTEALAAVEAARTEEARRSPEDRQALSRQKFLLDRAASLLNLASLCGEELRVKNFWRRKKILGNRMYAPEHDARRRDAVLIAPRFQAWPAETEIPAWITKRFDEERWLWDALAQPLQNAIREAKNSIAAIYKQAESEALDTESAAVRKGLSAKIKKEVDFSAIQKTEKARSIVLGTAARIRGGSIADRASKMKELGWTPMNWNFATQISALPVWLQRTIEQRLSAAASARRTRKSAGFRDKWDQGYPRVSAEDRVGEGRLDVPFNGDNITWSGAEAMGNGYLDISAPWNPPDHRGPRIGSGAKRYRSLRQMRKVTIYEPGEIRKTAAHPAPARRVRKQDKNRFSLNVLFYPVPAGARMKQYKLRATRDPNGNLRWFFIPTFELAPLAEPRGPASPENRTFTGVDIGWRVHSGEEFKAVHSWDESRGYELRTLEITSNRWARRYNARQANLPSGRQFPLGMTPQGLRDFASRKDALQRDFKSRMACVLAAGNRLPSNWDRLGKRGMIKMMTIEKSPEFAALQALRPEYESWAERDGELSRIYRVAWRMVSDNKDRQFREVARKILAGATDIGIEDLKVKQMAEAENEGATDRERHMENVQDRNRQLTAPAKFLAILKNLARKMGKRVHVLNPAYTSKTCSACGHRNDPGAAESFTCARCLRVWNRDENAARNLAQLARECSHDDASPLRCSRDGKQRAFHGLASARAAKAEGKTSAKSAPLAREPASGVK